LTTQRLQQRGHCDLSCVLRKGTPMNSIRGAAPQSLSSIRYSANSVRFIMANFGTRPLAGLRMHGRGRPSPPCPASGAFWLDFCFSCAGASVANGACAAAFSRRHTNSLPLDLTELIGRTDGPPTTSVSRCRLPRVGTAPRLAPWQRYRRPPSFIAASYARCRIILRSLRSGED
jgi:hypothetical protein